MIIFLNKQKQTNKKQKVAFEDTKKKAHFPKDIFIY